MVNSIQVYKDKFLGGDCTNTADGDFIPCCCVGLFTCGIGCFLYPIIYGCLRKIIPSVHYFISYTPKTKIEKSTRTRTPYILVTISDSLP